MRYVTSPPRDKPGEDHRRIFASQTAVAQQRSAWLSGDMRAIVVDRSGGPEVLVPATRPDPDPGPGEVLVEVSAAGVNFIDTYLRSGIYDQSFPSVPGFEGAGTVIALGAGVTEPAVGARVAWCDGPGSYASLAVVPADRALPVPDGVAFPTAAAVPLQGLTAHYLATSSHPVAPDEDVLIHAGAGGVGLLLTQIAALRGARVITTVSTPAKAELSRAAGADLVINYSEMDLTHDLSAAVREATGGKGVEVVYDGVGRTTFEGSLRSLARRGTLVLFGGSSGQVPPFDLQRLNAGGSLSITRPSLGDFVVTHEQLLARATDIFQWISQGALHVRIGQTFTLDDAAAAHRAVAARATTGKTLLLP